MSSPALVDAKKQQDVLDEISQWMEERINRMNLNSITSVALKKAANTAIGQIPKAINSGRAKEFMKKMINNRFVAKSKDLQRQLAVAYFATKVGLLRNASEKEKVVRALVEKSCMDMSPSRKKEILQLMNDQCKNYTCGVRKYIDIFSRVNDACLYALLE